jgi:predicted HTH domain antitoxin
MAAPGTDVEDLDDDLVRAVGKYALGGISEGKAAEIAGISRWEMRAVLDEAGIEHGYGPRNDDELRRDVEVATSLGDIDADDEA